MDEYSYINIFDTKGIEYLVIIGFLLILIPFWRALNKPLKVKVAAFSPLQALTESILKIPEGILYNRNHTWASLEREGFANVGLDDLLMHIVGPVNITTLKKQGDNVVRGENIAVVSGDSGTLKIKSPITGTVQRINTLLGKNGDSVNNDPYGKGWVYRIEPKKWAVETQESFQANEAKQWFKNELLRFKDFLSVSMNMNSPEVVPVILQEGGELADNPLAEMPEQVWLDFQDQFLDV